MKKAVLGCGGALVACLLVLLIGGCVSYNRLVALSQNVDEKWAQVQTHYQRRSDLIPNLVNTVSGAANFEKSTIAQVVEARASVGQLRLATRQAPFTTTELEQFEQAQSRLSSALSRLLAVVENYPDLKATANFRDLQAQLEGTENRIAVARRDFNDAVRQYNTAVKSFPTVLFAGLLGFTPRPYFQSAPGSESAPRVQFQAM
ncbi:MAG: LemA family protein [Verrucomicrobiae bacterium]|nr:LemA family protein [Verrucomicrobiae bacterium]